MQLAKAAEFDRITQNNGHHAFKIFQGLVTDFGKLESPYETSY